MVSCPSSDELWRSAGPNLQSPSLEYDGVGSFPSRSSFSYEDTEFRSYETKFRASALTTPFSSPACASVSSSRSETSTPILSRGSPGRNQKKESSSSSSSTTSSPTTSSHASPQSSIYKRNNNNKSKSDKSKSTRSLKGKEVKGFKKSSRLLVTGLVCGGTVMGMQQDHLGYGAIKKDVDGKGMS